MRDDSAMCRARSETGWSRRSLLGGGAALAAGAGLTPWLAGCTGSGDPAQRGPTGGGGSTGTITWWDQFRPLTDILRSDLFDPYEKAHPGVTVERREMAAADLGQAIQLARRSKQSPDVHSLAGLGSTPAALVAEDWFRPIDDYVDVPGSPVGKYIVDGMHRFGNKIYTFPVLSHRWHDAAPWLNTALVEKAGIDPLDGPRSWDAFRATAHTLTDKTADNVFGLVVPSKEAPYLSALLDRLAMASGAMGGVDWTTGDYAYASQPFLDAMEFLVSLRKDKSIHPASASMNPRDARARWVAGQAAVYLWGPWFIGGLMVENADAVKRGVGVWHIPTPQGGQPKIYSDPPTGQFWVSAQSKLPKLAADVMFQMTQKSFQTKLASAMDQPPILLDLVKDADVHPAYRTNVEYMQTDVHIAPLPQSRNPAVSTVLAEMRDVHPNPGEIVQSVLTGSTSDYTGALRTYNDKITKERQRAIDAAGKKGAKASQADWVFDDWAPGKDYPK